MTNAIKTIIARLSIAALNPDGPQFQDVARDLRSSGVHGTPQDFSESGDGVSVDDADMRKVCDGLKRLGYRIEHTSGELTHAFEPGSPLAVSFAKDAGNWLVRITQ